MELIYVAGALVIGIVLGWWFGAKWLGGAEKKSPIVAAVVADAKAVANTVNSLTSNTK